VAADEVGGVYKVEEVVGEGEGVGVGEGVGEEVVIGIII
jgi:hypothetical protein